jgi:ATP/maltotriose-dependent transcriptional regulator MalT
MPAQAAAGLGEAALEAPANHPYPTTVARLGLALLAIQQGDLEAVREQYQALKSAPSMMLLLISTDRVRGLLSAAMGEINQAIAHFEDALAFTRRAGYRPEMAWVGCEYADVLLQQAGPGDGAKARSLLEESLTVAQNLGMLPLTQRIGSCRDRLESQLNDAPPYPDSLTQREVEVLRLLAQGRSNSQISQELVVAEGTTRRHVANIYQKIGVSNRAEATRYALREGLLSLDETPSPDPGP